MREIFEQVLTTGVGLDRTAIEEALRTPDEDLPELLQLAHDVRMKWCGPEVEVEGIVSLKTGGCPEDCHFCSQSGLFASPVRSVWLDIPSLVEAAKQTAATGGSEFCIAAAVRGRDVRHRAGAPRPGRASEGREARGGQGEKGSGRHRVPGQPRHAHPGAG